MLGQRESAAPTQERRPKNPRAHSLNPRLLARVASLIPAGRDHAITAATLARILGVSPRTISDLISELRLRGALIGSSTGNHPGYFRPTTLDEARFGTLHLIPRAAETFRVARAMERSATQAFAEFPPTLFDEAAP
jgi:hypothetical protein